MKLDKRLILTALLVPAALALGTLSVAAEPAESEPPGLFDAVPGFVAPPLHPGGVRLETRSLGDGVFALLSNHPAVDNAGFIIGERGVLVVDAHINAEMARQIQRAVARVTDDPILYLVNTNYHGDHTFGNYAFPEETRIIAHRRTAERMRHFEHEKRVLLPTVNHDASVYADARLRLPDLTFDDRLTVDLGGRTVEIYHFGHGNTPGDTVVFEPLTRTAWTGNLVVGEGSIPPIFEGRAEAYLQTIARFRATLSVDTVIPGHGRPTDGEILGHYLAYLGALIERVDVAAAERNGLEATLDALPVQTFVAVPDGALATPAGAFLKGLHRLNVAKVYAERRSR